MTYEIKKNANNHGTTWLSISQKLEASFMGTGNIYILKNDQHKVLIDWAAKRSNNIDTVVIFLLPLKHLVSNMNIFFGGNFSAFLTPVIVDEWPFF